MFVDAAFVDLGYVARVAPAAQSSASAEIAVSCKTRSAALGAVAWVFSGAAGPGPASRVVATAAVSETWEATASAAVTASVAQTDWSERPESGLAAPYRRREGCSKALVGGVVQDGKAHGTYGAPPCE